MINSSILEDGLSACLDKMSKFKSQSDLNNYLIYGSRDFSLSEDVARLLVIATTNPSNKSPVEDICDKLLDGYVTDIDSSFIKEFLEMRERNKATAFMKSDTYKVINNMVSSMNDRFITNNNYDFTDGIVLTKCIRKLYSYNLDQNIESNKLAINYREPLIELFQNSLDCTLDKIRNGVKDNVQIQR